MGLRQNKKCRELLVLEPVGIVTRTGSLRWNNKVTKVVWTRGMLRWFRPDER